MFFWGKFIIARSQNDIPVYSNNCNRKYIFIYLFVDKYYNFILMLKLLEFMDYKKNVKWMNKIFCSFYVLFFYQLNSSGNPPGYSPVRHAVQ